MRRTNIYLDEEQCDRLDRAAGEAGVSRAELIRRVLDGWLAASAADEDADVAAIDASFGVLHETPFVERGPDARAAHLDAVWRLDV